MKNIIVLFPFAAILVAALSVAVGKAFANYPWVTYVGYGVALTLLGAWVALDYQNLKSMFKRKGARYGASSGLVVVFTVACIALLAWVSNKPRFNKSFDATKSKTNTLSEQSIKIIDTLNKNKTEVHIKAFFSKKDNGGNESRDSFSDLTKLYENKGANFKVEYIDPQSDPTAAISEKITSENTAIMRLGNQEARITTFNEEKFTNALIKIMKDKSKKIYFTQGHGEPELKGNNAMSFDAISQELENNKYILEKISFLEKGNVPDDAALVVLAGLRYDIREEEAKILDAYLQKGGSLLVLIDALVNVPNLNSVLETYGIKINNDLLTLHPNDPRAAIYGLDNAFIAEFDEFNPITKDFSKASQLQTFVKSSRSVSENAANTKGMKVTILAKTHSSGKKIKEVSSPNDIKALGSKVQERMESGTFGFAAVSIGKVETPTSGTEPNASTPERKIVVFGSSQLATNAGVRFQSNLDLFINSVNYLLNDNDFISIRAKEGEKSTLSLNTNASTLALLSIVWIYPFLFLLTGIALWWTRRKS